MYCKEIEGWTGCDGQCDGCMAKTSPDEEKASADEEDEDE